MSSLSVLMYHDLFDSVENADAEYDNYAVSFSDFESQINMAIEEERRVISIAEYSKVRDKNNPVLVTFDDGHASNYSKATDYLSSVSGSADFFINTATVGQKGYVSWSNLKDMVAEGMSVQSHSHDHIYLTTFKRADLIYQLEKSKSILEDKLGEEVFILSAPGGRINNNIREIASNIGYRYICDSAPQLWSDASNYIPRVPVYKNMSTEVFHRIISGDKAYYAKLFVNYQTKKMLKSLIGNKRYEVFRKAILKLN